MYVSLSLSLHRFVGVCGGGGDEVIRIKIRICLSEMKQSVNII